MPPKPTKTKVALRTPQGYTGTFSKRNDLNADGTVNTNMVWNLRGDMQYPVPNNIDVNKDGTIDTKDILTK